MTRVSVVLCTYNRAEVLRASLVRLVDQTAGDYEVVVVDNASTDGTSEVVAELAARSPVVRCVVEPTLGLAVARNRGIREARGEILAFTDDDVVVGRRWVEEIVRVFDADPAVAAVGGPVVLDWTGARPAWLRPPLDSFLAAFDRGDRPSALAPPDYPMGANMAVRREWVDRVGGFSEALGRAGRSLLSGEDREFFLRLRAAGGEIAYGPEIAVMHRVLRERLSRWWFIRRAVAEGRSHARIVGAHRPGPRALLVLRAAACSTRAMVSPQAVLPSAMRRRDAVMAGSVYSAVQLGCALEYARLAVARRRPYDGRDGEDVRSPEAAPPGEALSVVRAGPPPAGMPPARATVPPPVAPTDSFERVPGPASAPAAPDGLPERFGRNVLMNYVATGAALVSSLIVTPVLLHALGPAAFGVWVLVGNLAAYLELFELGFGQATTKAIANDAGRRPEAVVRTLNTSIAVLAGLGVAAAAVALVVAVTVPALLSIPEDLRRDATIALALLGVALAVSVPGDALGGVLGGHQRYDLLSASNLFLVSVTAVGLVAVATAGGGLGALALTAAVISLLAHGLRWALVRRVVPGLRLHPRLVERSRLRPLAVTSGWFLLAELAATVILRVDNVVIAATLTVQDVAVFAVAAKLAQLTIRSFRELGTVLLPHAASLVGGGQEARVPAVLLDGTRATMSVAVAPTLVLALLPLESVRAWVGDGYDGAAVVLTVLVAAALLRAVTEPALSVLAARGNVRLVALALGAEAVLNLGLSLLFVGRWGIRGVALGTLVASAIVSPPLLAVALRRLGVPAGLFLERAVLPHVAPGLATAGVLALARLARPRGAVELLLVSLAAVATYAIVYYTATAPETDRARIRNLARSARRRARRPPPPRAPIRDTAAPRGRDGRKKEGDEPRPSGA